MSAAAAVPLEPCPSGRDGHAFGTWARLARCTACEEEHVRKFGLTYDQIIALPTGEQTRCPDCGWPWVKHQGAACSYASREGANTEPEPGPFGATRRRRRVERAAGPDCPAEIAAIWAAL